MSKQKHVEELAKLFTELKEAEGVHGLMVIDEIHKSIDNYTEPLRAKNKELLEALECVLLDHEYCSTSTDLEPDTLDVVIKAIQKAKEE